MNKLIFLGLIIPVLMLTAIPNVSATGIRSDSGDDVTIGESICWVNGYDSGFAGKYDKDRAKECVELGDTYNKMWYMGCEDSTRTDQECDELINNPVEIKHFRALKGENDRTCCNAGVEDGRAGLPFNEEREDGCYEFDGAGGYTGGYQWGCEVHDTESTCELKYEEKQYYCPDHPDIAACADFLLHNDTYKQSITNYDIDACADVNVTCYEEINPEKYCLKNDNPVFCNTIGDLCDEDGFVKPEYPYCND